MKYFVYCRKSTEEEERQALSIESQKTEILKRFSSLDIIEILEESYSASKPGRPIFNMMMDRIRVGEAGGIIAWHPDRLSRNPIDGGNILYSLDSKELKDIKFCTYSFENTPEGKMFLGMMLNQSKYYTDKLSVDIKRGNSKKAELGQPPRWALTGYKNVWLGRGQKSWAIDEENKEGYHKILELAKNPDISIRKLVEYSKKLNVKTRSGSYFTMSVMDRWLRNKVLCGWFSQLGEQYKGDFEPLISEQWWEDIQYARGYRQRPRIQKDFGFLLPGLVMCKECGSAIVSIEKRKFYPRTQNHATYRYCGCSHRKKDVKCHQPSMKESELVSLISDYVERIQIDGEVWDLVKKLLREKHKQEMSAQVGALKRLQNDLANTKKQLGNLLDLRIRGIVETDEEYLTKKNLLKAEEARLESLITNNDSNIDRWLELAEKCFKTAYQAQEILESDDLERKRELIRDTGWNLFLEDKKLTFEYKKPFDILANRPNDVNWWSW